MNQSETESKTHTHKLPKTKENHPKYIEQFIELMRAVQNACALVGMKGVGVA